MIRTELERQLGLAVIFDAIDHFEKLSEHIIVENLLKCIEHCRRPLQGMSENNKAEIANVDNVVMLAFSATSISNIAKSVGS